ncbi:hypothetical protein P378_11450 [Desulforamulus profundi]|uniref:Uncharacterized protein n=1 Tax=Desulforamulus profundi TaxID=1383067 RepID=A0A2C6LI78_9FIRM|nr:hypothetical protein P378_11450 [Desulforamulus profundi]
MYAYLRVFIFTPSWPGEKETAQADILPENVCLGIIFSRREGNSSVERPV